jgi:hypothetical protein
VTFFGLPERGDLGGLELWSASEKLKLAAAINRVVYGDGGPYFEVLDEKVVKKSLGRINHRKYFDLHQAVDGSTEAYHQKRTVHDKPNAPRSAVLRDPQHRPQGVGYADYRIGRWYFDPDQVTVKSGQKTYPVWEREERVPIAVFFRRIEEQSQTRRI